MQAKLCGVFTFQIFQGNTKRNTIVTNDLNPPIHAKFVRIHPQTWRSEIWLRFEMLGCEAPSKYNSHQSLKICVTFILTSNSISKISIACSTALRVFSIQTALQMAMLAMVPFKVHVYLAGFAMLMGHAEVNYYQRNVNISYKVGRICEFFDTEN